MSNYTGGGYTAITSGTGSAGRGKWRTFETYAQALLWLTGEIESAMDRGTGIVANVYTRRGPMSQGELYSDIEALLIFDRSARANALDALTKAVASIYN